MSDTDHRVLKFRPRTLAQPPSPRTARDGTPAVAKDLSRYQNDSTQPDDYRHRMMTNIAALAFTVLLTGIGIWLAVKLADLRNNQDCVLMGRRDCAHISSPKD